MSTVNTDHTDFETFDNQFYPTPKSLGLKAFHKFKQRSITRLLEPQAGRGDLADVVKEITGERSLSIECVELDLNNQVILRAKGYRVVGTDFFRYKGASVYSHILMNPPFREGVKHVLHAWGLLFTGELVAILNAQDVRNPNSAERKQLVALIADHGSVEFIQQAFRTADTKRRTSVEIALIHLEKESAEYTSFIDKLQREVEARLEPIPPTASEIVIPRSFIENMVINFECAVEAQRQSCIAQARASHFGARFDRSIILDESSESRTRYSAAPFNEAYDELKERAWSTILRSTTVLEKLSSQAQKRVESSFKEICALEFTYENIWGFIDGLIAQQSQIQQDMICDVFDTFTKYHSENRVYYQGWKSNSKHRLNAFRIKGTRIVLPAMRRDWYNSFSSFTSLNWDDEQQFRDFDKVFAMLDGKQPESTFGLCQLFRANWNELQGSTRMSSDYFDVRMYRKAGTFHLYPRRKDLIERINRIVGQARQWLPHDQAAAPEGFWKQYERADQIAAKAPQLEQLANRAQRCWNETEKDQAYEQMEQAHLAALQALGITYDYSMLMEHEQSQAKGEAQFPLLLENSAA